MVIYCVEWSCSPEQTKGLGRITKDEVDSRNFSAHYLMLDGMREPVYLPDAGSNVLRASRIFGDSRCRL